MKITGESHPLGGLSAMVAGIIYVVVGPIHPPECCGVTSPPPHGPSSPVSTTAMCFFLLGMTGIYARQVKEAGWLGLAGYLLFSLWLALIMGFTFAEVFILPLLATAAPTVCGGLSWGCSTGPPAR